MNFGITSSGLLYMVFEFLEERRKKTWWQKIFQWIMAKTLLNLMKTINPQIQWMPSIRKVKKNYTKAPCDKILKAVQRRKDILYRRTKIRMTPYFLSKSMQTRKQCSDISTETVNLEFSTQWKYLLKKTWN